MLCQEKQGETTTNEDNGKLVLFLGVITSHHRERFITITPTQTALVLQVILEHKVFTLLLYYRPEIENLQAF